MKKLLLSLFLALCCLAAAAQQKSVSGKVTSSEDGSPIPGANVLEDGTSNGTVTDADGKFILNVNPGATISVSFIGFDSQKIAVGDQTNVDVVLQVNATALQEIVVVGYGTAQKKDVTGAVENMATKDFNKGVITNPQDLIMGKFAGVSVTQDSGAPGAGTTIRSRGGSSLTANNDPLIVID